MSLTNQDFQIFLNQFEELIHWYLISADQPLQAYVNFYRYSQHATLLLSYVDIDLKDHCYEITINNILPLTPGLRQFVKLLKCILKAAAPL